MSSADNRQRSAPRGPGLIKKPLDLPPRVHQLSPAEQPPMADAVSPPAAYRQGDVTLRQGLIKNPMNPLGVARQQPLVEFPSLPTTAPLPDPAPPVRNGLIKNPLKLPGIVGQSSVASQPTPTTAPLPSGTFQGIPHDKSGDSYSISPRMTRPLSEPLIPTLPLDDDPDTSPRVTRHLPELKPGITRPLISDQTGTLPLIMSGTTSVRQPVVIPATEKRPSVSKPEPPRPPQKRHWRQIVVACIIGVIIIGTLLSVVPVDKAGDHILNPFQPISSLVPGTGGNPSSLAQQDATATVTHQDGYDPGTGGTGVTGGAFDHFAFGQCTYYASMRYHQLTGHWVPWMGNAFQWAYVAGGFGWVVSSKPHVPSIIVLQPYVQYAGPYGHVAVVESINADGSVSTSNWNWYGPGGGGWARTSVVTFRPGPGVSFIWI